MTAPIDQITLYRTALQFLRQQELEKAASTSKILNERFPDFADGWQLASRIALLMQKSALSLTCIESALSLKPENPSFLLHKAQCLHANAETGLAIVTANQAAELGMSNRVSLGDTVRAALLTDTGCFLVSCKQFESALPLLEKAVLLQPDKAVLHSNLAAALRFLGKPELAEAALDRALALDPDDGESWSMRSSLRKQTSSTNHISALKQYLASNPESWNTRVHLHYSLAKEYEDLQEYASAFEQLAAGAALRRRHTQYEVSHDIDTMHRLKTAFTPELFSTATSGYENREPIFIVGLPRTGSTLVERILACHDQVYAAGELTSFAMALIQLAHADMPNQRLSREELVRKSVQLDFSILGKSYIDSTRPHTGVTPQFTDKMPLNFLYCGLIKLALPGARIIHVQRHPMDTCFAIFKQLFSAAYPWSYDLEMLGQYYVAYRDLMAHWENVMPDTIYSLHYEDLVSNQEAETRRLLEYCGLPWQNSCLEFHLNPDATTTASASQVRQPLYNTSVGRWKSYSRQLQPLAEILSQFTTH